MKQKNKDLQPIPYGHQSIDSNDINEIVKVLKSEWMTSGPTVELFEKKLCELTGANYAVACSNGTAALHLSCLALDIKNGELGITSPLTFLASANCVEFCGGNVDFIDIGETELSLSPAILEKYCEEVAIPKFVIPVDFAGIPADLPAIWALAKKFGFYVIEDAAHAIGSTFKFEKETYSCGSCSFSDLAIFSFHPVKTVTTGEGGAILTNNKKLAERLRLLRNHGITKDESVLTRNGPWYYEVHDLGFNYRLTDLQCALGLSQLHKLNKFKVRRTEIVAKYNDAFSDNSELITPMWSETKSPCFHLYTLQFRGGASVRLRIYNKLKEKKIYTQVHYIPVYWQPYYKMKYKYPVGKCPNAEKYYERCLSIPLYPAMTDEIVDYVIDAVNDSF